MKRILAFIIVLSMLFSFAVISRAEEEKPLSEAVETLVALGIMEGYDDDLMLDKVLTRAEFVTMVMRIMNPDAKADKAYFEDVNSSHWAFSDISTACMMGIVHGNKEHKFLPDRPVVYEEMVKMLVCALGYGTLAELKGGYPGGYMTIAQQKDLLDGATGRQGLIVKRGLAAEMIFNALDIPIMQEEGFGKYVEAKSSPDKTLLSENMNIRKGKGVVNANDVTGLALAEDALSDGMVKIDEETFLPGTANVRWQLGYYVTYYADISEFDENPPLIYTHIDENKNKITTVNAKDISDSTTKRELVYQTKGNPAREVSISLYADLIYNGVSTGGFTAKDLKPANGTVVLIDNDYDKQADVVLVNEYETILVGGTNSSAYLVYDRDDNKKYVELDPKEDDYSFIIYEDGKECNFSAIAESSILSVAKSKNKKGRKSIVALLSNNSVSGVFDSVSKEESIAVIDGVEYDILSGVYDELIDYLGSDITVYLDAFGNIAGVDDSMPSEYAYGYLIVADIVGSLSKSVQYKILTETGEIKIFNSARKVSLNANPGISGEDILTELRKTVRKDGTTSGSGEEQLVRYALNRNGEITAIDTVATGKGGEGDRLSYDVKYRGGENAADKRRYLSNLFGSENAEFAVNDKLLVFSIPKAEEKGDDTKYGVYGKSFFVATQYYELQAYDIQDDMTVAACIVQEGAANAVDDLSRIIVVDKVKTALVNDEYIDVLVGYYMGQKLEYYAKDETTFVKNSKTKKKYERGDIIKVAADKDGVVNVVQNVMIDAVSSGGGTIGYSFDDGDNKGKFFVSFRLNYSYATYKEGNTFVVQTNPDNLATRYPYVLDRRTSYYLYEAETDELSVVTVNDLDKYLYARNPNARVAVASQGGTPMDIVIYDFSK